jgi:hypothetical protein
MRMSTAAKLMREVRRMLSERLTLLFMALMAAGAVWFSLHSTGRTASDAFILEPAKNSAVLGALLFMLLTLVQFHRDYKNNTDTIILTCTDPIFYQLRRTLALICTAVVTTLIITLFALPYGMAKAGDYFQPATFLTAWYLIFLGALIFSVLLSSGFYMLTRRAEAVFIIMAGLILLSKLLENMYTLNPSYLFYWVQTTADDFSDLITNRFQIDMLLWNRLFCLLVSLGVWTLGLCSFRRYGRGLPGSFLVNCRRAWIPIILITALSLSTASYAFEPIFDDSKPVDFSGMLSSGTGIVTSQGIEQEAGNPYLTLTGKSFDLDIDAKDRTLSGVAKYKLENATSKVQTLPVMTNTGLSIDSVLINGAEGKATRGETGEDSTANWSIELPAAAEYEVEIRYSGRMRNDNTILQSVTYGIVDGFVWLPPLGVSPSFDINVSEDSAFFCTLSLDEKLEPVFPKGKPVKGETKDGKTEWTYAGGAGSYGTGLFAAEYMTRRFEAGGLDIELKYFAKHDQSITDMDAVNVIKAAIDYFTDAYGPLVYDKNLIMLELPAYVSGGFAGGNMSAMDETSYDEEGYLPAEAATPDQGGGLDVLVHEIAHQWWGLATMPMQDGASNWSAEGITCYSTYCFMKQYFGEEYAREHFVKEWQQGWNTYQNAFYIQHPEYLAKLSNKDSSNIMGSFVNMRLYDIMPLMMLKGEEALSGTEAFQKKLSELYTTHLGQPITYDDFLKVTGLTKEALNLA